MNIWRFVYQAEKAIHASGKTESEMLELRSGSAGSRHSTTLIAMNNLALTYRLPRQVGEAKALCLQTIEIGTRPSSQSSDTCAVHNCLRHLAKSNCLKRKPCIDATWRTRIRVLGPANQKPCKPSIPRETLILAGNSKTLNLLQQLGGKNGPRPETLVDVRHARIAGRSLMGLKRFPEAEPLFWKVTGNSTPAPNHAPAQSTRRTKACSRLASSTRVGISDQSGRWKQRYATMIAGK